MEPSCDVAPLTIFEIRSPIDKLALPHLTIHPSLRIWPHPVTKALAILALVFLSLAGARAQVTIVVNHVPENTPPNDTLYIVGYFNNWTPGDKNYRFRKHPDGTYSITFPNETKPFEYKITRGPWTTVEGDLRGGQLGNRVVHPFRRVPYVEFVQVLSWEDLAKVYSWDIVVQSVPGNTPSDAQLYISGSFNDWKEMDPAYRLARLDDGTFAIKINKTASDSIQFKFNRGSWSSVECRTNGRILQNRQAVWKKGQTSTPVYVQIEGWNDLGGGRNWIIFILFLMAAIQAFVLALAAITNRDANQRSVRALAALLVLTGVALLARLSVYSSEVFELQPKLYLVSDLIYVLYAPVAYYLVRTIMGIRDRQPVVWAMFVVAGVVMAGYYLPVFVMPRVEFVQGILDRRFVRMLELSAGLASLVNIAGFVLGFRLISQDASPLRDERYREARTFAIASLVMAGVLLLVWLFADLVYAVTSSFRYEAMPVQEAIVDFLWALLALTVYAYTFLYLRFPALFKSATSSEAEPVTLIHHKEDIQDLKVRLDELLDKGKPYLNPRLTLEDLAERMHINLHTLSWVINDGYGKNFFDLINERRVDEFIRLAEQDKFKNYTFLAVAMEAGFNSKTTFNRVFKKQTGKTPREYFGVLQDETSDKDD